MPDDAEADKRWRAAMAKITKDLTDKGMLIEAGWIGFRSVALVRDAPTAAIDEHKASFFAGALHLWASLMVTDGIMEPGGEPTPNDERRMGLINDELKRFGEEFERRYRSKMQ
jgi:hypothetical protein